MSEPARSLHTVYGRYGVQLERLTRHVEEFREQLVPYVRAWARHGIHFSALPWMSPAWIGLLYQRVYRDEREFARSVLEEYAQCFTTAWINLVTPVAPAAAWLRNRAPEELGLTVTVVSDALVYRFPYGHPDPARRGEVNNGFLDPGFLRKQIVPVLCMLEPRVRVVILRIAPVYQTEELPFDVFLVRLLQCLDGLPRGFRYAVEINNPEYVRPEYLIGLHRRGVAHVLHTNGIPVLDQIQVPGILTANICILRLSDDAPLCGVPVRSVMSDEDLYLGVAETIRRCVDERKTLYAYINDHRGTPAPVVMTALMRSLNAALAALSSMRKKAA